MGPPSPMDQPKQFSQEQPANIHMPTPKLPSHRNHMSMIQIADNKMHENHLVEDELNQSKQVKWPFGKHKVCQVLEVEIPESYLTGDIRIVVQSNVSILIPWYRI